MREYAIFCKGIRKNVISYNIEFFPSQPEGGGAKALDECLRMKVFWTAPLAKSPAIYRSKYYMHT